MKEENKYYWTDIEIGEIFECTKEYRDSILKLWEDAKPSNIPPLGQIILYGTGEGDTEPSFKDSYLCSCDPCTEDSKDWRVHIEPLPKADIIERYGWGLTQEELYKVKADEKTDK